MIFYLLTKFIKEPEVIRKDEELQPIVPKKGDDNNQQPETNNSSSKNNETPTDTEKKGNSNTVGQSSANVNTDSNKSKVEGGGGDQNTDESTTFESNYEASNAFVDKIHKGVGQGRLDEKNVVKERQNLTNN